MIISIENKSTSSTTIHITGHDKIDVKNGWATHSIQRLTEKRYPDGTVEKHVDWLTTKEYQR